jgi:hypothetical protein
MNLERELLKPPNMVPRQSLKLLQKESTNSAGNRTYVPPTSSRNGVKASTMNYHEPIFLLVILSTDVLNACYRYAKQLLPQHGVLKDYELNGKFIHTEIVRDGYSARATNLQQFEAINR